MINTGEDLFFLSKLSKRKLRQALASVRRDLKRANEINGSIHNRRRLSQFEKLSEALKAQANPMSSVYEVFQMLMDENVPEEGVARDIGYHRYAPNGGTLLNLRSVSSALLFQLWCQRSIILPYRFNFQKSVNAQMRSASSSKVVKFISEFEEHESDAKRFGRLVSKRIKSHCWVWLFTTSWVDFEDVTIDDYQALSKEMAARKHSADATNSPSSVNLFVSVSLARCPDEIRFSTHKFTEVNEAIRAEATRVGAHSRNKIATEQGLDPVVSSMIQTEKSVGFMKVNILLEGTEFEIGEEDLRVWCDLFSSYLDYRQVVQGYEDTKTVTGSLRKLADYISFFLPTKLKEGNLSADLVVRTPKCFRRGKHIVTIDGDISSIIYREYLGNFSKSNDTLRALIGHAAKFFEWIETHYSEAEHEDIAGPSFRNPFNLEFDQPISKKRYHTNKRNISRYALPHLLLWLYEIESFGIHLLKLEKASKLEGVPKITSSNIEHHLSPADFEFEASYKISGETVIIDRIPLRLLRSGRTSGPIWLSHLRWQIFTLETGLRHQSTQWLDHRSWKQMSESESEKEVRNIHINTDKVHGPFVVPVLARVWNLLCRQNRQEESSGNAWQAVPYEGRKHSRFSDVEHLFRNYKGKYIKDSDYWEFWRLLMFSFQCHVSWLKLPLRELVKYSGGVNGGTKKDNVTRGEVCSLKLEYEHSPHSCRSTFVTNRVPFVDLGTLADQVGHSNELATQHYVYPDFVELSKKLEQSDGITIREPGAAVTGGPAYVDAKSKNSALRKSFGLDRETAIRSFQIFNLTSIHAEGAGGMDLLRSSRASEIVFRDTHICPVGEACPSEVIEDVGEAMRCGACRFACKSLDHLPAIEAKRNSLMGRIRSSLELIREINQNEDRDDERNSIHRAINIDSLELMGWTQTVEVLEETLAQSNASEGFIAGQPDIVRLHLERVSRNQCQQEFLLQRILDADAYPALSNDELRLKASRLMRQLSTDSVPPGFFTQMDRDHEVKAMAASIRSRLQASGVSLQKISQELSNLPPGDATLLPQIAEGQT